MPTTLTIKPIHSRYDLPRAVCSYGYFILMPNIWSPEKQTLSRPIDLAEGIATFTIAQPAGEGSAVKAKANRALSRTEITEARLKLTRMLRTDDDTIDRFHKLDPRWKKDNRGLLFRSPTFYEDVIRTVTNCNITWPGTCLMNERLCSVINPAFPRAEQLARRRPASLRERCKVGYRDVRIVELCKMFSSGEIEAEWYEDPARTDDEIRAALLKLPGIGPFAAANILQLLGRYAHIPLDTESVRHGRQVLNMEGTSASIMKRVDKHFSEFEEQKFRSYWCELWSFYEKKKGPAWTWEPRTTGRSFTSAQMRTRKKKVSSRKKTRASKQ
ncbi:MAG: hypothetical protein AAGB34_01300 [Planctomycetota bacterium]